MSDNGKVVGYVVVSTFPDGTDMGGVTVYPTVTAALDYEGEWRSGWTVREVLEIPGESRIIARAEGEEVPDGARAWDDCRMSNGVGLTNVTLYHLASPPRRVLGKIA